MVKPIQWPPNKSKIDRMNFCPQCGEQISKKTIDGVDRYVCEQSQCHYINWDNPVPVVAAIVKYNNKILLAQNAAWPDGRYSFVSGYLESREQPDIAVLREVKEELGLDAQIDKFVGHFIFNKKNQLLIVFSVMATGSVRLNNELEAFKLFDEQEILEYMFSYPEFAQSVIKKYLTV